MIRATREARSEVNSAPRSDLPHRNEAPLIHEERQQPMSVQDENRKQPGRRARNRTKYDYDASGYRVRVEADGNETYLFRDASGQVLSEFQRPIGSSSTPAWNKDYVYALGKSLALVRNLTPATPKRPWASDVDTSGLVLNWDPPADPDILGYDVERIFKSCGSCSEEPPSHFSVPVNEIFFGDSFTASTGGYVKYRFTAMDTAGNLSDPSPQLVVYLGTVANPPAPLNVTASPGDRTVMIRWSPVPAPNNDLWGYYVERKWTANGSFLRVDQNFLNAPEYLDTQLNNGQTYWYRVRAVDTANRVSTPDPNGIPATPLDNIPPGKLTDVFAEPDRVAGRVNISWNRGLDLDIASYRVYRSSASGTLGSQIASISVVSGQASYGATDTAATQGTTYFYSVLAVDGSGNLSAASDQVSVRPRHTGVATPMFVSALFNIYDNGTTSNEGRSGYDPPGSLTSPIRNGSNTSAEDDDIIRVIVTWQPATAGAASSSLKYRVYRTDPDEPRSKLVATTDHVQNQGTYTYNDTTVTKGDYTYYVVAWAVSSLEESAASPASGGAAGASDHPVSPYQANVSVRNVFVTDGQSGYSSPNAASRRATVNWSRVTQPELVGYNVYRMCSWFSGCDVLAGDAMDTFACEPVWVRLNTTPVAPGQRVFEDSSTGGMQGCFRYAVRPVGPNGVEGPIDKIVEADLIDYNVNDDYDGHAKAATYLANIPAQMPLPTFDNWDWEKPVSFFLDGANGINALTRTGSPDGPPPVPTAVSQFVAVKDYYLETSYSSLRRDTKFAEVLWTMNAPPRDLLGFHVETAGSPDGPWKRVTEHPVAWWERRYIAQGLGVDRCNDFSGHTSCLSYRVIAVDEAGNESQPVASSGNPSASLCPMTPDPPTNLRASTYSVTTPTQKCQTLLQWDAPPGNTSSTEYYVYRLIINSGWWYFYDTKHLVGQTSYIETGGDTQVPPSECPDNACVYPAGLPGGPCETGQLEAYYVTARNGTGGESPRSNLVFWACSMAGGYDASNVTDADSFDAIAALGDRVPGESLACWLTDGPTPVGLELFDGGATDIARPMVLRTAPMLRLGLVDPPWELLNLHTDHLGSVRLITSPSGVVLSAHNYFPFGEEITPQFSRNTHWYTGHERDKETGLDYMKARYFGSTLPRFLSPDPVGGTEGTPQSWNRYTYVLGNPMKLVDPTGMYWAPGTPPPDHTGTGGPWGPCYMCRVEWSGSDQSSIDRVRDAIEAQAAKDTNGFGAKWTKMKADTKKTLVINVIAGGTNTVDVIEHKKSRTNLTFMSIDVSNVSTVEAATSRWGSKYSITSGEQFVHAAMDAINYTYNGGNYARAHTEGMGYQNHEMREIAEKVGIRSIEQEKGSCIMKFTYFDGLVGKVGF